MGIAAWNQSFHNVSISFASEQLFPLGQSSISCKSHGSTRDSASKGEHEVHHWELSLQSLLVLSVSSINSPYSTSFLTSFILELPISFAINWKPLKPLLRLHLCSFLFLNIYIFTRLHWVLVATWEIFSWGMRDLIPWPGIEPHPTVFGVLATGPSGKSYFCFLLSLLCSRTPDVSFQGINGHILYHVIPS